MQFDRHSGESMMTTRRNGQGVVAHGALKQYMCTGNGNPVYGNEKENKRQHMHGPTGMAPGQLAARLLLLCAHMCLPCITGVLEPDQKVKEG